MGVVYLGLHVALRKRVAVKLLSLAQKDETVERFVREARLAAHLESPHLVRVLDVDHDKPTRHPFIVMEYVRGVSAAQWQRDVLARTGAPPPEQDVLRVVAAATRGLAVAHRAGIVHRDIKPDNILIPTADDGAPLLDAAKLADLGLAKHTTQGGVTTDTIAMGTPGFIAPEQIEDAKSVGPAADVFSMGATIYALLAGDAPFKGKTPFAAMKKAVLGERAPISVACPRVTPSAAATVERCLETDPSGRFPDAVALLSRLDGTAPVSAVGAALESGSERDSGSGTESGVATAADATHRNSRRTLWIALALAALVVLGFVVRRKLRNRAAGFPAELTDLAEWDGATAQRRRELAQKISEGRADIKLLRMETFSAPAAAGGATHEIAVYSHQKSGLELALIPGGDFEMGSASREPGRASNEKQHTVRIAAPFLIARTECTQAAWDKFRVDDGRSYRGTLLPIDGVSWEAAVKWCRRAGMRLPTEAEWEYAARAGTTTAYSFGDDYEDLEEHGNILDARAARNRKGLGKNAEKWTFTETLDDGYAVTATVGEFAPNAFGLLDVHGNVFEWCADEWEPDYEKTVATHADGSAWVPTDASYRARINRGGAWNSTPASARSAHRGRLEPDRVVSTVGFRPALSVTRPNERSRERRR